jgi:CDGSH-type Zn-finger protein
VSAEMRVQNNPADIGRCGCGRREFCDGSHGLTEAEWQAVLAKEQDQQCLDVQSPVPPMKTTPGR